MSPAAVRTSTQQPVAFRHVVINNSIKHNNVAFPSSLISSRMRLRIHRPFNKTEKVPSISALSTKDHGQDQVSPLLLDIQNQDVLFIIQNYTNI